MRRGARAPSLVVDIVREAGSWSRFRPIARTITAAAEALAALPQLAHVRGVATVLLTGDAAARALNRTWRGKDKPTNVLSFPAPAAGDAPAGSVRFLGDIVLAAETVAAEAARDDVPPRHHLQHLVIHGLLHLLGYDHETDSDAAEMEALETAALARIGVADPYKDARLDDAN